MRFMIGPILLLAAAPAFSQIPDTFENLQVLPKDIDRRDLIETMRGFSFSLGARCEHCHVGGPALDTMSFASDEKDTKRTARRMLLMVRAINEEHIANLETKGKLEVSCFTCHRGVVRPEPIEAHVEATLSSSGLEAAIARYRALRKEQYGSGAYDFGVTPLNRLGESLLDSGNADMAAAVLELNAEFHPDSSWLHDLLGEAYFRTGDRERARASFEKSLSLNPENSRAKKRLEELRRQEPR